MKILKCIRAMAAVLLMLFLGNLQVQAAALQVLACEPEWAALANALGGEKLKIYSATSSQQDPHHIQARPSLIAKARRADLLICTGAELEIGWLPVLLRVSGNPAIQIGGKGYFLASNHVNLLEVPQHVDRSMGDVHPAGNPHIQLDPKRMQNVAKSLTQTLITLDPSNAKFYRTKLRQFNSKLNHQLAQVGNAIDQLKGKHLIVHHDNWIYLLQWLQMKQVGTLEPKPGLPPSIRHLNELVEISQAQPIDGIIYASYQDPRSAQWLADKIHAESLAMNNTVPDWKKDDALIHWYSNSIRQLTKLTVH